MTTNTDSSDKLAVGRQMVKDFIGEEHLRSIAANTKNNIFTRTSEEFIAEVCFSGYARPDLTFKERSLMNIAMLIALGRGPELRIHIRAAAHNGWSEEQICEACRHAMVYCGVPAGRDALIIASDVFEQSKEKQEQ